MNAATNEIEQEIQAKGLNAPRVTPQMIEDAISAEFYFTAHQGVIGANGYGRGADKYAPPDVIRHDYNLAEPSLQLLTFCVLVLKNGFTVTGESACASPENFDAELGRKIARQNAVAKIWPLEGYLLKSKLNGA